MAEDLFEYGCRFFEEGPTVMRFVVDGNRGYIPEQHNVQSSATMATEQVQIQDAIFIHEEGKEMGFHVGYEDDALVSGSSRLLSSKGGTSTVK